MTQPLGIFDYSIEQYHASEGLSRSSLWTFKQLPYKFWYEKLSGEYEPPVDKDAFILGELLHTLVLEPTTVLSRFTQLPEMDRRTKQGKEDYLAFMTHAEGKTIVKRETAEQATAMCSALRANSNVCELLEGALMEKSIYWRHEPTGLICKARPDIWQGGIVSDLKTTLDAGFRGFQASAYKYGYFLQAGMVYEALKSIGEPFYKFINICVEKAKPHPVALYLMDDEALAFGIEMYHALMERIAICYEKNVWPDYGISTLTIPRYASIDSEVESD